MERHRDMESIVNFPVSSALPPSYSGMRLRIIYEVKVHVYSCNSCLLWLQQVLVVFRLRLSRSFIAKVPVVLHPASRVYTSRIIRNSLSELPTRTSFDRDGGGSSPGRSGSQLQQKDHNHHPSSLSTSSPESVERAEIPYSMFPSGAEIRPLTEITRGLKL